MSHKIAISIVTSLYQPSVYLRNFLKYVSKISNLFECELILIHNDALLEDIILIDYFKARNLLPVNHIMVPREGLYNSWNRGIEVAKGELIAIWNVDDIRNPYSLLSQKEALLNSDAAMCYGDYYSTNYYGKFKKDLYQYNSDYNKLKQRASKAHVVGCFPMWKKEIHGKIGYFDEQFKLVGDWEFQMRVVRNYNLVKANAILGFCLVDKPHRLSSNRHLQYKEQTIVWLRFKLYAQVLLHYLPYVKGFKINKFISFGNWEDISNTIPNRRFELLKKINSFLLIPVVYSAWGFKRIAGRIANYFTYKILKLN